MLPVEGPSFRRTDPVSSLNKQEVSKPTTIVRSPTDAFGPWRMSRIPSTEAWERVFLCWLFILSTLLFLSRKGYYESHPLINVDRVSSHCGKRMRLALLAQKKPAACPRVGSLCSSLEAQQVENDLTQSSRGGVGVGG